MKKPPLTILIAGPYRSGTNDVPHLMEQNLLLLENAALTIFRAGHIPLIGEWLALPLLRVAGSTRPGDEIYSEISYPIAHRILTKCDGILRIGGESAGADNDVKLARELGLKIYFDINDIKAI